MKMVKCDELTWNDHPVFTRGIFGCASLAAASIDDVSPTLGLSCRMRMIGGQLSFSIAHFKIVVG
jgi:hypothetical protein